MEEFRPPLANQLFEDRPIFVSAMEQFKECMPLIPSLRKEGVAVEKELARIQGQAKTYPHVLRELAAVRYYLHFGLHNCQRHWYQAHRGITNYAVLLREIERWRYEFAEQVCFVSFNYDTMLDESMYQVLKFNPQDLGGYVANDLYRLIKLHGSVNWGIELSIDFARIEGMAGPTFPPLNGNHQTLIDHAEDLRLTNQFRMTGQFPMYLEGRSILFPAIAIPVEKKDEFVCPPGHVGILEGILPKVDKIIMIGWRATEEKFVSMLGETMDRNPRLMIVSGTADGAEETFRNVGAKPYRHPNLEHVMVDGGFTGLITYLADLEKFLRKT